MLLYVLLITTNYFKVLFDSKRNSSLNFNLTISFTIRVYRGKVKWLNRAYSKRSNSYEE